MSHQYLNQHAATNTAKTFAVSQISSNQLTYSVSGAPSVLPWDSCLLCLVGNSALVCPQGEVGLPGPPGLDGEKVILCYRYSILLARQLNCYMNVYCDRNLVIVMTDVCE